MVVIAVLMVPMVIIIQVAEEVVLVVMELLRQVAPLMEVMEVQELVFQLQVQRYTGEEVEADRFIQVALVVTVELAGVEQLGVLPMDHLEQMLITQAGQFLVL